MQEQAGVVVSGVVVASFGRPTPVTTVDIRSQVDAGKTRVTRAGSEELLRIGCSRGSSV